jgi:hypothetical protein
MRLTKAEPCRSGRVSFRLNWQGGGASSPFRPEPRTDRGPAWAVPSSRPGPESTGLRQERFRPDHLKRHQVPDFRSPTFSYGVKVGAPCDRITHWRHYAPPTASVAV